MDDQIEYHCPQCGSITPLMVGITECIGCGRLMPVIAVWDEDRKEIMYRDLTIKEA